MVGCFCHGYRVVKTFAVVVIVYFLWGGRGEESCDITLLALVPRKDHAGSSGPGSFASNNTAPIADITESMNR